MSGILTICGSGKNSVEKIQRKLIKYGKEIKTNNNNGEKTKLWLLVDRSLKKIYEVR